MASKPNDKSKADEKETPDPASPRSGTLSSADLFPAPKDQDQGGQATSAELNSKPAEAPEPRDEDPDAIGENSGLPMQSPSPTFAFDATAPTGVTEKGKAEELNKKRAELADLDRRAALAASQDRAAANADRVRIHEEQNSLLANQGMGAFDRARDARIAWEANGGVAPETRLLNAYRSLRQAEIGREEAIASFDARIEEAKQTLSEVEDQTGLSADDVVNKI
jgi:hypothetical protein